MSLKRKNLIKNFRKKVNLALRQAKLIEDNQNCAPEVLARQYATYMYSEIQSDPKYNRLHNYASAELLYKNMAVVSVCVMIMGITQWQIPVIVIGAIGAVLFVKRPLR